MEFSFVCWDFHCSFVVKEKVLNQSAVNPKSPGKEAVTEQLWWNGWLFMQVFPLENKHKHWKETLHQNFWSRYPQAYICSRILSNKSKHNQWADGYHLLFGATRNLLHSNHVYAWNEAGVRVPCHNRETKACCDLKHSFTPSRSLKYFLIVLRSCRRRNQGEEKNKKWNQRWVKYILTRSSN